MRISLIALLIGLAALLPTSASAHFLATDGTIGATLHVDPNDDPVATQPASFFFDITDTAGKFSLAQCRCTGILLEDGKQIYSAPIGQASLQQASFAYTFPTPDVYQVRLSGSPLTAGAFQPFTINWNIRAERPSGVQASGTEGTLKEQLAGGIAFAVLLLGSLGAALVIRRRSNTSNQK